MKKILDIKQNEWIKISEKASTSKTTTSQTTTSKTAAMPTTQNRFEMLNNDEDCEHVLSPEPYTAESENLKRQIHDYRLKNQFKFKKSQNKVRKQKRNEPATQRSPSYQTTEDKKLLVIGDSMVKHIERQKIKRAAGCRSAVHSYSGARVEHISQKIKEHWSEDEEYDAIILHVGTNNLVSEEPEEVATKMNTLIEHVKDHAKSIAISSVIKRYDNRVPASKITRFNYLLKDLCTKHASNISFLSNDHIDRSLLNRSNLHLNQQGDRALGGVFCSFLKSSVRVRTSANIYNSADDKNNNFFHHVNGHRNRDWTIYLQYVNRIMKN